MTPQLHYLVPGVSRWSKCQAATAAVADLNDVAGGRSDVGSLLIPFPLVEWPRELLVNTLNYRRKYCSLKPQFNSPTPTTSCLRPSLITSLLPCSPSSPRAGHHAAGRNFTHSTLVPVRLSTTGKRPGNESMMSQLLSSTCRLPRKVGRGREARILTLRVAGR